jgi:hypothetical protein
MDHRPDKTLLGEWCETISRITRTCRFFGITSTFGDIHYSQESARLSGWGEISAISRAKKILFGKEIRLSNYCFFYPDMICFSPT